MIWYTVGQVDCGQHPLINVQTTTDISGVVEDKHIEMCCFVIKQKHHQVKFPNRLRLIKAFCKLWWQPSCKFRRWVWMNIWWNLVLLQQGKKKKNAGRNMSSPYHPSLLLSLFENGAKEKTSCGQSEEGGGRGECGTSHGKAKEVNLGCLQSCLR